MSDQDPNAGEPAQADPVDVFKNTPEPSQQAPAATPAAQPVQQQQDPYQELLAAITDENGEQKYKSVSDALVAASHAQKHIPVLEEENAALKAQGLQTDVVQQIRDALNPTQPQTTPAQPGTEVDLKDLVRQTLIEEDQATRKASNKQVVNTALAEKFGDKAGEAVAVKAQELGLTQEFLLSLGETSPTAFLKYFDTQPSGAPSTDIPSAPVGQQAPDTTEGGLPKPPENIMLGASQKTVTEHWNNIKEHTKKRLSE